MTEKCSGSAEDNGAATDCPLASVSGTSLHLDESEAEEEIAVPYNTSSINIQLYVRGL
jgi:hypothetical protein